MDYFRQNIPKTELREKMKREIKKEGEERWKLRTSCSLRDSPYASSHESLHKCQSKLCHLLRFVGLRLPPLRAEQTPVSPATPNIINLSPKTKVSNYKHIYWFIGFVETSFPRLFFLTGRVYFEISACKFPNSSALTSSSSSSNRLISSSLNIRLRHFRIQSWISQ